jgi:hypothetical protein
MRFTIVALVGRRGKDFSSDSATTDALGGLDTATYSAIHARLVSARRYDQASWRPTDVASTAPAA